MTRLVIVVALVATGASLAGAAATPRHAAPVEVHVGAGNPTFWVANDADFRRVPYAEYERLRKAGACQSDSTTTGPWPEGDEFQFICST
jgi:hypothetical protein